MRRDVAIVLGLVGASSIGACGRSDVLYKDDQYGAHGARGGAGGSGATGGSGVHTGGTNFTGGTGGSFTGGTGGSSTGGTGTGGTFVTGGTGGKGGTGGSFGVGGSVINGGTGGTFVTGGAAGASGQGPNACVHTQPTCDTFTNFSTDADPSWGLDAFMGGVVVFGNGIVRDSAEDHVHVTGTVSDYSNGIAIYFTSCADLSKYAGVYFTLFGMTGDNDEIEITPQTNSDYPWKYQPTRHIGACTSMNSNPFVDCVAPGLYATLYSGRQYAYWSDFSGGSPVVWNSITSPTELVGIQWLFPYDPIRGSYQIDVTLDDVGFIRSGSAAPDCGPAIGTGGMGGIGGVGGFGVGGQDTGGFANLGGIGGFSGGTQDTGGFANLGGIGGFSGATQDTGGFANLGGIGGFSSGGVSNGGVSNGGLAGVSTGGMSTAGDSTLAAGTSAAGLSGSGG